MPQWKSSRLYEEKIRTAKSGDSPSNRVSLILCIFLLYIERLRSEHPKILGDISMPIFSMNDAPYALHRTLMTLNDRASRSFDFSNRQLTWLRMFDGRLALVGLMLLGLLLLPISGTVHASSATLQVLENQPVGTAVGDPVTNSDLVGNLTHALSGTDAGSFSIDSASGQLSTAVSLDYEVRNSYAVNVDINHDNGTASIPVTISVLDIEEAGVLSVAPTTLRAGTMIRARLTDPDGGMRPDTGIIWYWSVSTDGTRFTRVKTGVPGHYTREASEVATFTPDSTHVGKYLRVNVRYHDRRSTGNAWNLDKSAEWTSTTQITAATALPELTVRPLVSGLSIPWDIAFTPDGTMLFTERSGKIYSRRPDGQMQQVEADVTDIVTSREVGMMGIAVDPSFSVSSTEDGVGPVFGRFYTCMAVTGDSGPEVQVIKWDMKSDYSEALRLDEPLVAGIPLTWHLRHGGCRIRFGSDGYLWITTGDGYVASGPQDLTSLAGKVLRVDAQTGAGAPDNPFTTPSDSRIYTYGHRNPQGLAFRPGTNQVWTVEHGPDRDDEINLLTSGGNYGWDPTPPYHEDVPMTDLQAFPEAIEAKWQSWFPAIAPSGAVFLEGAGWGAWNGRLAVALLKVQYLKVFEFASNGTLLSETLVPELYQHYGRLRSPVMGPDGVLYITTSNGPGKDHILQVFGPSTPRVSGPDAVSYSTGRTDSVATFTSHHLTTPVSWTLSGQDAEIFSINAAGVLSFASSPDFEDPKDADEDNVYRVLVEAQAANDGSKVGRAVAVTVLPPKPIVSIVGTGQATEGNWARFTITANPAPTTNLDVSVTVSASGDYGATTGQRTVTIPPSGSVGMTVSTTNDEADEPNGSVTATLDTPSADAAYKVPKNQDAATVIVVDNDEPGPEVSITAVRGSITEGGAAGFIITADPAPPTDFDVSVTVSTTGEYGATTGKRTVTIPSAGSTRTVTIDATPRQVQVTIDIGGKGTLKVDTVNDDVTEDDGSVTATLDTGSGYTVSSSQSAATVSVADDDEPPTPDRPKVSVTAGDGVTEGGDATFTVTASPAPSAAVDVSVTVSSNGDYAATTGKRTVTIPTTGSVTLTVSTINDDDDEANGSVTATLDAPAVDAGYTVSATQSAATVTVSDDDILVVSISAGDDITEGGDASFTLTADPAPTTNLDVSVTVAASGHYGIGTGIRTVTIPTTGSATLTMGTTNDEEDEADGMVTVFINRASGYTLSPTQNVARVKITDDDSPSEPVVSVTAGSGVTEGGDATFTVTASPAPSANLDVGVTVSASGDYGATTGKQTVTIPTSGSATLTIGTTNDDADETDGSVTATLDTPAADAGYTVSASQGTATVSVADDDDTPVQTPEVSISAGSGVTEGGDATFTITASPAPAANLDVSVTVSQSGDYGATTGKQTVTIPTSGSATLTIGTTNDGTDEADGSVTATLDTPASDAGYTVSSSQGAATVSVADDDDAPPTTPEVSITAGSGVTEGGDATFTITASPSPAADLDVSVTVSQSGDYGAATGKQTVTIPTTGSATLTVGTINDGTDEADGSVTATLDTPAADAGYTVSSSQGAATVSIADDDDTPPTTTPEVSITAGNGVTEGGDATFTITASPAPAANLDVSVTVSQSGDYGATTGKQTVTMPTTGSFTLTVGTTNDGTDEADGSVTATLDTPAADAGYTVSSSQGAATVSVADDDDAPPTEVETIGVKQVTDSTATIIWASQGGNTQYQVGWYPTSGIPRLRYAFTSETEHQITDLEPETGYQVFVVAFRSSEVTGTYSIKVSTLADGDSKDSKVIVTPPTTTPEVSITAGNGVTEGGDATFTITASPAPAANLDVSVTVSQSGDYGATTGKQTVTIPTTGSFTLTVGTTNDDADETDGSVTATLDTPASDAGYTVSSSQGAATVSVSDDDDAPPTTPEVSITAGSGVTEGGDATFTITASPSPAADLDVSVTVSQSGDYGATTGKQTVTIPTTGSITLTVGTTNDGADEADGSVTATLDTPASDAGYTVSSSQGAATVSVADDDDAPPTTPEVSITAGNGVTEGGDATFTITASPSPAADLDVSVTVSQSGNYGATTGKQTVTIPTTGSFTLTVGTTNDGTDEADGSVTATLDTPASDAGYTVSSSQGAATVSVSDDDVPEVSITAGDGVTEGSDATFTITASPVPAANLDVSVTVSQSGDYGATTGKQTVTIPTTGSITLTVGTTNDGAEEADGSVTATLDTPASDTGYTVSSSQSAATVSVSDDDVPEVSITAGDGVTEGGDATFTITASPVPAANLDVSVTVSQSGDYGATTGKQTVTIPTTGSVTLTVGTTNDGADEADGSVTATLDTPASDAGYTVSAAQGAATVSVSDDDDQKAELSVTVEDASGAEGDIVEFRILLSHALTEEFEVSWYAGTAYHLLDDRANSSEYQAMYGVMVFEPGVTALTGEVWLYDDSKDEPDEYFAVEAFLPGEWFTPTSVGTMTIVDDD